MPLRYTIPNHPAHPVYELSEATLIGRGTKRDCHLHPGDSGLCIKVARYADSWWECQEQNIVDWYYINSLKKRNVPLDHLADCLGWVQTSYGAGLVTERVVDGDGYSTLTLRDAVGSGLVDMEQVTALLAVLKSWAFDYSVAVADLNGANLMLKKKGGEYILVFVDGIGSRKANLKFSLYQKYLWLARLKTKRQWQRQETSMFNVLQDRIRLYK
nr:YrbL family protein [Chromohalobacter canadensis]